MSATPEKGRRLKSIIWRGSLNVRPAVRPNRLQRSSPEHINVSHRASMRPAAHALTLSDGPCVDCVRYSRPERLRRERRAFNHEYLGMVHPS